MAPEDAGGMASFMPLLEKNVSSTILMSAWCSTMDIVVLVTEDGQLQLFRLNWERLWTKQPKSPITSLQWRPDGKELAYGDEQGFIYILTAEDGSLVESRKAFSQGKVIALHWVVNDHVYASKAHVGAPIGYRAGQLLYSKKIDGQLSERAPEYAYPGMLQGQDRPKPICQTLCGMNSLGDGVMLGEGLLPLVSFKIDGFHEVDPNVSIRMSANADSVCVVWRDTSDTLSVSRMDTSVIHKQAPTIYTVGCLLSNTLKDINMAYLIMANLKKNMKEVESTREDHLEDMRVILGGIREPEKDVYDFLIRGNYSIELKSFVAKEAKLKEVSRAIDACFSEAYLDIVSYLQPCLERIAFRLGDLRGFSLTPEGEAILGLNAFEVGKCERRIANFASLAEHLREVVLKASSGYRNFYSFLSMLQHREAGEKYPYPPKSSIDEILQLITSGYHSDEVHTMLDAMLGPEGKGDEELLAHIFQAQCEMNETNNSTQILESKQNYTGDEIALEEFMHGLDRWLDGTTSSKEVDILVQESTDESVPHGIYGLDYFKALFLSIMSKPSKSLSTLITRTHDWQLLPNMRSDDSFSMTFDDDIYLVFASGQSSSFCHIKIDKSLEKSQVYGGHVPGGYHIASCLLYKSNSILLSATSDHGSLICLVPSDRCPCISSEAEVSAVDESMWTSINNEIIDLDECRTRLIQSLKIASPFAASVTRGVALAVYQPQNTVTVFDLEEDEEPEDEYE